jgi:predicted amidophosphoribosyltransferase
MTKKNECLHCGEVITEVSPSIWISDKVWGDETICDEADGNAPHEPTPTEMACEGCGEQIEFSTKDDEQHCARCIREYEQEEIHRNWSYYNA